MCICILYLWGGGVRWCYVLGDWLKAREDGLYAAWWSCYCLYTCTHLTFLLSNTFVRHAGAACIPTFCPAIWSSEISPLNVKYTISEWDLASSTAPRHQFEQVEKRSLLPLRNNHTAISPQFRMLLGCPEYYPYMRKTRDAGDILLRHFRPF